MPRIILLFVAAVAAGFAQSNQAQSNPQPLTALPYTPSLDPAAMNRSVEPCVNFYQYSCGTWIKDNPIPADQPSWDVYAKLTEANQRLLWGMLLQAGETTHSRSANEQKIGDFFNACMDEAAVEKAGLDPLKAALDAIAQLKSKKEFAKLLAVEHLFQNSGALFTFDSNQDFENSQQVIAFAEAGGLGLPDRDYYTKTDAKSVEIRQKYVEHVARMLTLIGEDAAAAKTDAATIMAIESVMAEVSLTRVQKREPHNLFHKMTPAAFKALTPSLNWNTYFVEAQLAPPAVVNVTEPAFYKELEKLLKSRSLADWQAYLRWHLVRGNARYLSSKFVNADFDFYSKYLAGIQELAPRWKRCVRQVDRDLGEALGQVYVEKVFSPEAKAETLAMTKQIEVEMGNEIGSLDWMSDATKQRALEKLHGMVNKIGYPDKWRDYSSVVVKPDDYLGDVNRAVAFEHHRDLNKIGKPVDRTEWDMTPPTVNAYYNAQMNDINFPAGVLQPPLFDLKMDAAPNYGNTGGTIGHELTHGFDDEGRQFDAQGNLRDWWTEKDAAAFEDRINCIRAQYAQYTIVDDIKINSKLTSGEDVADLGGEILAWLAWKSATKTRHLEAIDGLTPEQRFFVGMAQWACGSVRPETLRMRALTDPHSPYENRINGVVANMPEFQQAFSCKLGQPMVNAKGCKVW